MSIALNYINPKVGSVPEYDFTKVNKTEICDQIIKDCNDVGSIERLKAVALFVAAAAIGYFTYLTAAYFVASYGILAAGFTFIAVATLFPITLVAFAPPFIVAAKAIMCWSNANQYVEQRHLASLRKAELISVIA